MESKQVERIETACKLCIFADWQNNTQVGCKASRLKTFKPEEIQAVFDDEKEFFVIKRLCTSFRNLDWNNGVASQAVMEYDNTLPLTIVVMCNDFAKEDFEELSKTIESLNYPSDKIQIVFGHDENFPHKKEMVSILKDLTNFHMAYMVVQYFSGLDERSQEIETLNKIKNNYFTVIDMDLLKYLDSAMCLLNKTITQDYKRVLTLNFEGVQFAPTLLLNPIYSESIGQFFEDAVTYSKAANLDLSI